MIVPQDGNALSVMAIDLSMGGVKLSCDKDVAFNLLPDKQCSPSAIQGMEARLELDLPNIGVDPVTLVSKCRVVNFYRQAENRFEIGCQFVDTGEDLQLILSRYIMKLA